jgi:hypothetical protein
MIVQSKMELLTSMGEHKGLHICTLFNRLEAMNATKARMQPPSLTMRFKTQNVMLSYCLETFQWGEIGVSPGQ